MSILREHPFPCPRCGEEDRFIVEVTQIYGGTRPSWDYPGDGPEYEAEMQTYKGRLGPCDGEPENAEHCYYVPSAAEQERMIDTALEWAYQHPEAFYYTSYED